MRNVAIGLLAALLSVAWSQDRVEVPPPPFTEGIFPCTECHNKDLPANRQRRALTDMHDDIVLKHDEQHRWCLDCHDAVNRNQLKLWCFGGRLAGVV